MVTQGGSKRRSTVFIPNRHHGIWGRCFYLWKELDITIFCEWQRVVWYEFTGVSEKCAVSVFKLELRGSASPTHVLKFLPKHTASRERKLFSNRHRRQNLQYNLTYDLNWRITEMGKYGGYISGQKDVTIMEGCSIPTLQIHNGNDKGITKINYIIISKV